MRGIGKDLQAAFNLGYKARDIEIVRCKDCKYYDEEDHNCLDEMAYARCWMPTDFCSFGERREE